MHFKSTRFKMVFRLLTFCSLLFSLFLQFMYAENTNSVLKIFCYFTPLVYILSFLYYFYLLCADRTKEHPVLKGAVYIQIFAAGLFLLIFKNSGLIAPFANLEYGLFSKKALSFLAYGLFPIFVFLDYVLFSPKGQYKPLYPPAGLLFPAIYGLFLVLRAKFGSLTFLVEGQRSAYPYLFLDASVVGENQCILTILFLAVGFLSLGYLFYLLDWLLGGAKKKGRK